MAMAMADTSDHTISQVEEISKKASSRVFGITELLEQILLTLPPKNIIRLRRVNRFCCDAISNSPSIQHQLFFQSKDEVVCASQMPEVDLFLDLGRNTIPLDHTLELNHLLFYPLKHGAYSRADGGYRIKFSLHLALSLSPTILDSPTASSDFFGKMFVTCPPTSTLHLFATPDVPGSTYRVVYNEDGIRVEDVLRAIYSFPNWKSWREFYVRFLLKTTIQCNGRLASLGGRLSYLYTRTGIFLPGEEKEKLDGFPKPLTWARIERSRG